MSLVKLTNNPYIVDIAFIEHMNTFVVCMLVVIGLGISVIIGAMQNASVFALIKTEDPDAGGEVKAPATGGLLKPKVPIAPSTPSTNEEPSKPLISKSITPKLGIFAAPAPYKVKVTFTSITVHNDREGIGSGDGEYDLNAYVHGKLVKLTDMSRSAGGAGLWDVSSGETVNFPSGSEITVDIDRSQPLSIFTVGSEVDGCGRTAFPTSVQNEVVKALIYNVDVPFVGRLEGIRNILHEGINYIGCTFNQNDAIGYIVKAYAPTGYEAGPHTDMSNLRDFTLRYTISVIHPPSTATTFSSIK